MKVARTIICCGLEHRVEISYQRPFRCPSCGKEFTVENTSIAADVATSGAALGKDTWLATGPSWCCLCSEFIEHWWESEHRFGPVMHADRDVGGWYCSQHKEEELAKAGQKMEELELRISTELYMDRETKVVKRLSINAGDNQVDVMIDQGTGALRIRTNANGPGHTGRLVVIPVASNVITVEMERVGVPDFVAPGVDRTLFEGNNFIEALRALGYDRYRIDDHESGGAICRLWRGGESVSSISIVGGDPLHAAHSALSAARYLSEGRDD